MPDYRDLSNALTSTLYGAATGIAPQALDQLGALLALQGKLDPTQFQLDLQDIDQRTMAAQRAMQGRMAGLNMQNAGLSAALFGAIQRGGTQDRTRRIAQERQAEYLRQMQNISAALGIFPTALGHARSEQQRALAEEQMKRQERGALIGGLAGLGGAFLGGPLGAALLGGAGQQAGAGGGYTQGYGNLADPFMGGGWG